MATSAPPVARGGRDPFPAGTNGAWPSLPASHHRPAQVLGQRGPAGIDGRHNALRELALAGRWPELPADTDQFGVAPDAPDSADPFDAVDVGRARRLDAEQQGG